MKPLVPALCLVLAACAHTEPRVVYRDVVLEKPAPCAVKAPPEPDFPDTDEAIREAPDVYERGKLFVAGRLLRMAYAGELQAALKACQ